MDQITLLREALGDWATNQRLLMRARLANQGMATDRGTPFVEAEQRIREVFTLASRRIDIQEKQIKDEVERRAREEQEAQIRAAQAALKAQAEKERRAQAEREAEFQQVRDARNTEAVRIQEEMKAQGQPGYGVKPQGPTAPPPGIMPQGVTPAYNPDADAKRKEEERLRAVRAWQASQPGYGTMNYAGM